MSSIKNAILTAKDLKHEDVTVSEWGVTVRVQGMDDEQHGTYQAKAAALRMKQQQNQNLDMEVEMRYRRAELLVQCLLDPDTGERIFTDGDAKKLAKKNTGIITALYNLLHKLSDLDKTFEQKVADAKGNSESGQS